MFLKNQWFVLFILYSIFKGSDFFGQVIISEVMFNPAGSEQTDEFVEIVNLDPENTVDLAGWKISDGEGDDGIIDAGEGTLLGPQQTGLILDQDYFAHSEAYASIIPDGALILTINGSTIGSGGLSNSKEEIIMLLDPISRIADSIRYSIYITAGHSFEKIDLYGLSNPDNWAESKSINGTPGLQNSLTPVSHDLALIDIIYLCEFEDKPIKVLLKLLIKNTGLKPISDAMLYLFEDINHDSLLIDDEQIGSLILPVLQPGDTIFCMFQWTTEIYGIHHMASVIITDQDERGENNYLWEDIILPYPTGTLVINEIMYDPIAGFPEWVELYNPQSTSIDLNGWAISDADTHRIVYIDTSCFVEPSGYALVCETAGLMPYISEPHVPYIILKGFPSLNNNDDTIHLFDPQKKVIDRIQYDFSWGGGDGVSLERICWDGSSQDDSNWHGCLEPEGMSPGIKNSITPGSSIQERCLFLQPNPFSPDGDCVDDVTSIYFRLPFQGVNLSVSIYDVRGRCIRDLRCGVISKGDGILIWDGLDNTGRMSRTGIYIIFLKAIHHESGAVFHEKTTVVLANSL